ncbi:MAG TPA: penicillin acylase family protein [Thermoanaerobaculia bacterium]|nr:penicillin acylase family protein [Thermoanaerobaculia bacterium]
MTIPGRLDVRGVTAGGVPVIVIGFNRSVARSHTVSTGSRAVVRELTLAADSPTAYVVDGPRREMQRSTVTIDVRRADGSVTQESRTFYSTDFGPIMGGVMGGEAMPSTASTAYAFTDPNLSNRRLMRQWLAIGQARNVAKVRSALATHLAIPWVNTLAADARGACCTPTTRSSRTSRTR